MSTEMMRPAAIKAMLKAMESEFAAALPKQIPVEKFIRTLMTAIQMRPELMQVDQKSLISACMKAAADGLLLDGREAVLNTYKMKNKATGEYNQIVQYIPMIGGILKKVRQSNELLSLFADVAYQNEKFIYVRGDEERIDHEPLMIGDRGPVLCVYGIAKTKDGGVWREVMRVDEVEAIRDRSPARDKGPWVTDWNEMAKKTVLRRLGKRLPMSTDLERVLNADQEEYRVKIDPTPPPPPSLPPPPPAAPGAPNRLKSAVRQKTLPPPAPKDEDPREPPKMEDPKEPPDQTEYAPGDIDDDLDF